MHQADLSKVLALLIVAALPLACLALLDRAIPLIRGLRNRPERPSRVSRTSVVGRRRRPSEVRVGRRVVVAGLGLMLALGVTRVAMQRFAEEEPSSGNASVRPPAPPPTTIAETDLPSVPEGWALLTHDGAYLTSDGRYLVAEIG